MGSDASSLRSRFAAAVIALTPAPILAQQVPDLFTPAPTQLGEGWQGFADVGFLFNTLLTLTVAAILGALIAYHPRHRQTADTLEEIEAPKVFIMYAVIGAIIGILVVKYGLVVGFVLFGIGGLIRFRTVLRSPSMTGQVIYVTLIGLSCGLDLPHVAVLATAFGYVFIYVLESRITYQIDIRALPADRIAQAAVAYRAELERQSCVIKSEKKNPEKERVTFIFQSTDPDVRDALEGQFATNIEASMRGAVDWGID